MKSITTEAMTIKPVRNRLKTNLGLLLESQAAKFPHNRFITLAESGENYSYRQFNTLVNQVAHGIFQLGMSPQEHVLIMLNNGLEFLTASYALKKLAAVEVAINSEFRGVALERMLGLTSARILVTASEYFEALAEASVQMAQIEIIITTGQRKPAQQAFPGKHIISFAELSSGCGDNFNPLTHDTDTAVILFSSGTTGVSKGCLLSHRSAIRTAEAIVEAFGISESDCVYTPYPLFHVGAAHYDILAAMISGARVVLRDKFSLSAFWKDMVKYEVTWLEMMGSINQLVWSAPVCPEETQHQLRIIWSTPIPVNVDEFEKRFNARVARGGGYGSTDAGFVAIPLIDEPGGKVLDNFQAGIVDERDELVPIGTPGELVVRPLEPGIMSDGYFGMPEKTLESRRNLWFHTGDIARLDETGRLHWMYRMNERIRVLGEMVSAFEIEEVILTHPAIEDCAVIGIASDKGEEDVKAFITLKNWHSLDEQELAKFCYGKMSRYMIPKFIQVLDDMPRTPSGKAAKSLLKNL